MLDPKPKLDILEVLERELRIAKYQYTSDAVVLSYGLQPEPWACLVYNSRRMQIPLPDRPYPYSSWKVWFTDYLEHQLSILSSDIKVKAYAIQGNGDYRELYRRDPEVYENRNIIERLRKEIG